MSWTWKKSSLVFLVIACAALTALRPSLTPVEPPFELAGYAVQPKTKKVGAKAGPRSLEEALGMLNVDLRSPTFHTALDIFGAADSLWDLLGADVARVSPTMATAYNESKQRLDFVVEPGARLFFGRALFDVARFPSCDAGLRTLSAKGENSNAEEAVAALAEVQRVVRPGGLVLVTHLLPAKEGGTADDSRCKFILDEAVKAFGWDQIDAVTYTAMPIGLGDRPLKAEKAAPPAPWDEVNLTHCETSVLSRLTETDPEPLVASPKEHTLVVYRTSLKGVPPDNADMTCTTGSAFPLMDWQTCSGFSDNYRRGRKDTKVACDDCGRPQLQWPCDKKHFFVKPLDLKPWPLRQLQDNMTWSRVQALAPGMAEDCHAIGHWASYFCDGAGNNDNMHLLGMKLYKKHGLPLGDEGIHMVLDFGGGAGHFARVASAYYGLKVLTTNLVFRHGHNLYAPFLEYLSTFDLLGIVHNMNRPLPLRDGTFDVVHTAWTLQYLPGGGCEIFMREAFRLLRIDGFLVVRNMLAGTRCVAPMAKKLGMKTVSFIRPQEWQKHFGNTTSDPFTLGSGRGWVFQKIAN